MTEQDEASKNPRYISPSVDLSRGQGQDEEEAGSPRYLQAPAWEAAPCEVKFEEILRLTRGCVGLPPWPFKWTLCRPPHLDLRAAARAKQQAVCEARSYEPELSAKIEQALAEETQAGADDLERTLELDLSRPQYVYEVVAVVLNKKIGLGILQREEAIDMRASPRTVAVAGVGADQQAGAVEEEEEEDDADEDEVPELREPPRRTQTAPDRWRPGPFGGHSGSAQDDDDDDDCADFGNTNELEASEPLVPPTDPRWGHMPLQALPGMMMPQMLMPPMWPPFLPPQGPQPGKGGLPPYGTQQHSSTRQAVTDETSKTDTKALDPIQRPQKAGGEEEREVGEGDEGTQEALGSDCQAALNDYGVTAPQWPVSPFFPMMPSFWTGYPPAPETPPPGLAHSGFVYPFSQAGPGKPPSQGIENAPHKDGAVALEESALPAARTRDASADQTEGLPAAVGQQEEELVRNKDPKQRSSPVAFSVTQKGERTLVQWPVPDKTFDTFNVNHSSPTFDVTFPGETLPSSFMLLIKPHRRDWSKRGANFRKSEGKGAVSLKCTSVGPQNSELRVQITLSVGHGDQAQESGNSEHDFVQNNMFSFKKDQKEPWDLKGCQDPDTNCVMFTVGIRPLP